MVDMVLLQRKLYFSKDPVGVHNFPGGVQLPGWGSNFPWVGGGGPNAKFYINSYNLLHNCRYPPPPLDPHMNLVNETLQTLFNLACSDMPGSSSIVLFDSLCPSQ